MLKKENISQIWIYKYNMYKHKEEIRGECLNFDV